MGKWISLFCIGAAVGSVILGDREVADTWLLFAVAAAVTKFEGERK